MNQNLLYIQVNRNENKTILEDITTYSAGNTTEQLYVINAPLGDKRYYYSYQNNAIIILSPKHKILFIDLKGEEEKFGSAMY